MQSEVNDLTTFLPSYWTSLLKEVPVLGLKFDIIELNNDFIEFLESDGLTLDEERPFISGFSSSDDYSSEEEECSEFIHKFIPSDKFPELHNKIKSAIQDLGGVVVPKLNWTVPKVSNFYFKHYLIYILGFDLDFSKYFEMYVCQ